jgi:hypothetical protein
LGIDHFANVECVVLYDRPRAAEALTQVRRLAKCRSVIVQIEPIWETLALNDEAIETLASLPALRHFEIRFLPNTDRLLAGLARSPNLTRNLESLELILCDHVGDDELRQIGHLTGLRSLVANIKAGNDALASLAGLTNLAELNLSGWHSVSDPSCLDIGDEGLAHIGRLNSLERLGLSDFPQITDAGLLHLRSLSGLRELVLEETGTTDEGIAALQKALPGCKIVEFKRPATGDEIEDSY